MLVGQGKNLNSFGEVLFRGSMPPSKESFARLRESGIQVTELPVTGDWHWELQLVHDQWGKAEMICPCRQEPPPPELAHFDINLIPSEVEAVAAAGSLVLLRHEGPSGNVLRDRKCFLRLARAVMGQSGLAAMDHSAQRFWSRDALNLELEHDADLDLSAIFSFHAVADDQNRVRWLHSHGLGEIGYFDFDILDPSEPLLEGDANDVLAAIAYGIVEGRLKRWTAKAMILVPEGFIAVMPAAEFQRRAAREHAAIRDEADTHEENRVVLCEPRRGFWQRWFSRPVPSRLLSEPIPESTILLFSNEATALMAERAKKTYSLLQSLSHELRQYEFVMLVKLGYATDEEESEHEHLWFEVHELHADRIDATLLNEPFDIAHMHAGQRDLHPVERLTDWQVFTPLGSISPRQNRALRQIRAGRGAAKRSSDSAFAAD